MMDPTLRRLLMADLHALLYVATVLGLYIAAGHVVQYLMTPPWEPLAGPAVGLLCLVGWLLGTRYPAVRKELRDAMEDVRR